jgi:hypothetical protein
VVVLVLLAGAYLVYDGFGLVKDGFQLFRVRRSQVPPAL